MRGKIVGAYCLISLLVLAHGREKTSAEMIKGPNAHRLDNHAIVDIKEGATVAESSNDRARVYRQVAPVRGVWMHPAYFGSDQSIAEKKIAATLDEYAKAGINHLFILVKNTSGHVYYASEIGVKDKAFDWDFFALFLTEARKRKMEVQPWFCVFPESGVLGQVRQHPEWLISNPQRERVAIANPALPAVRDYEISLMLELVQKYDVHWIHLDYIRYPCEPTETYFSFDAETLRLFKEDTGIDMNLLKARDTGNIAWNEWLRWNRDQVTLFVRQFKSVLQTSPRPVKISAAVFPDPEHARVMVGQDWVPWVHEGLVDMINPMLYTGRSDLFAKLVRKAVELGQGRTLICPGIGLGAAQNWATPETMLEQIQICQSLKTDGQVFFSAYSLDQPFLDLLRSVK